MTPPAPDPSLRLINTEDDDAQNHRPASQVVVHLETLQEHNEKAPSSWLSP